MSDAHLNIACFGFVLTAIAGGIGVAVLRYWVLRRKVLDVPNDRSLHRLPTPRGGGLVITILVLVGWLPFALALGTPRIALGHGVVLGCSFIIAGISWLDDLRGLSARLRLFVHVAAALISMCAIGWWDSLLLPWVGQLNLGWVGFPLTLFWIVGFTNAFNFMDGIDGIAGSQAVVSGVGWAIMGMLNGQPEICALGLLIAGSALGFLIHNWSPAKIFMGDVGSAFLGYILSVLPLLALKNIPNGSTSKESNPLFAVLLVCPFVCDSAFTFLRRWRKKENLFAAHRSHVYQRLVLVGLTHSIVTKLYVFFAIAGVIMAFAWRARIDVAVLGAPILFLMLVAAVHYYEKRKLNLQPPTTKANSLPGR